MSVLNSIVLFFMGLSLVSCSSSVSKRPILKQDVAVNNANSSNAKPSTQTSPRTQARNTIPSPLPDNSALADQPMIQDEPAEDEQVVEEVEEPAQEEVNNDEVMVPPPLAPGSYPTAEQFLEGQATGADQMAKICARPGNDRIRNVFCPQGGNDALVNLVEITSLREFQAAIGLAFPSFEENAASIQAQVDLGAEDPVAEGALRSGRDGVSYAITSHSSSLVKSFTSAINPRAVIFSTPVARPEDTALADLDIPADVLAIGFVRGEQFVEIAAKDQDTGEINFFLLAFTQDCNAREENGVVIGCTDTELLTASIEEGWTGVNIYEDTDLNNTIGDCLRCHVVADENGIPTTTYRMQELLPTWTHWFSPNPEGQAMLNQHKAAHQVDGVYVEQYFAGIPTQSLDFSSPADLQNFVQQQTLSEEQPNEFRGDLITPQIRDFGMSTIWQGIYDVYAAGNAIAPPYASLSVLSEAEVEKVTGLYQNYYVNNVALPENTKHTYEFFSDAASQGMARTFAEADTPEQLLIKACSSCHNPMQNQGISRANFTIDPNNLTGSLALLDDAVIETAISRIFLPEDHLQVMPPSRDHVLSETQRLELAKYLKALITPP